MDAVGNANAPVRTAGKHQIGVPRGRALDRGHAIEMAHVVLRHRASLEEPVLVDQPYPATILDGSDSPALDAGLAQPGLERR